jgi:hypothetical protein
MVCNHAWASFIYGIKTLLICLIKYCALKTYRRVEVQLQEFITSVSAGSEKSDSRSGPFIAAGTVTDLTGGSVGHETDLNAVEKKIVVSGMQLRSSRQ